MNGMFTVILVKFKLQVSSYKLQVTSCMTVYMLWFWMYSYF